MDRVKVKFFIKKHKLEFICIIIILILIGLYAFYTPFKQKIYSNNTTNNNTKTESNKNSANTISKNNNTSDVSKNSKVDIPSDIVIQSKNKTIVPLNSSQDVKNYLVTSNVITKDDTDKVNNFITNYINTLKQNNKIANLNYYYPAERAEFYKKNKYDFYSENGYYTFNVGNIKITDKGLYNKTVSCAYCHVYDVTYDLSATHDKTSLNYQIHSTYYITKFQNHFYIVDFEKTCTKK